MSDHTELLNDLRWKKFPVLDDGFVCLVDVMGDDQAVVQAARVSYGEGTAKVSDDRGLIRYLLRHRHTTPFEMAEIKLLVRVPMDCWRQWIRHRTANVNEYSTRYSLAIDAAQTTPPDEWRTQADAATARGAASRCRPRSGAATHGGRTAISDAGPAALRSADRGRAWPANRPARICRSSTYTEAYWKVDLHNLLHFLALRMDGHAQWEIREYADDDRRADRAAAVSARVGSVRRLPHGRHVPHPARAGRDRTADATSGSRAKNRPAVFRAGFSRRPGRHLAPSLTRCRERDECREKLTDLGLLKATTG